MAAEQASVVERVEERLREAEGFPQIPKSYVRLLLAAVEAAYEYRQERLALHGSRDQAAALSEALDVLYTPASDQPAEQDGG